MSSIFVFVFTYTLLSRITFGVLQKPCQGNYGKFQRSGESIFGGSEKDHWSLKIPKWQHELASYYKWEKLVSYFLNNAAKTWLYGLKISENIEIGHFFQSRIFFHLSSNLHTSCLSAVKTCSKRKHILSIVDTKIDFFFLFHCLTWKDSIQQVDYILVIGTVL